jgi:hypothetical protein
MEGAEHGARAGSQRAGATEPVPGSEAGAGTPQRPADRCRDAGARPDHRPPPAAVARRRRRGSRQVALGAAELGLLPGENAVESDWVFM